jgi:hypothetical protein
MFDPTLGSEAPQRLALQTRRGGAIENWMNPTALYAGVDLQIQQLRDTYPGAQHRAVGPSAYYNCHGLTFAARRTGIDKAEQVQRILDQDGYIALTAAQPVLGGDVAVYREGGDIIHSGIVMYVRDGVPWVLGKWGDCHEVVHRVLDCPYSSGNVIFYRVLK